jgi:hypothetical protein
MADNVSPTPPNPAGSNPRPTLSPAPPRKKGRWLLYGCGGLLAFLLIVVATVAITIWWIQRPIKPVVLTPKEKQVVEEKLKAAQGGTDSRNASASTHLEAPEQRKPHEPDRVYTPGSKSIRLTEREINGLLNENTDLGRSVRIEFGRDAVNAYVAVPIPQDFPVGGGRTFRARGRFALSIGPGGSPYAALEDVTVLGLSLPKAWLGGIKGENLLADAAGRKDGKPILRGIKSLHVEPGALVLEVED